jgi:hypothetical protein
MNVAASTDAATFLVVSSLLFAIWRDVIEVFGVEAGAKADAPETHRRAMTAVENLNIILKLLLLVDYCNCNETGSSKYFFDR